MANKITTIKLTQETKTRLSRLGAKDESYEIIVKRLLDHCERTAKKGRK
jgi:hypothetical protein